MHFQRAAHEIAPNNHSKWSDVLISGALASEMRSFWTWKYHFMFFCTKPHATGTQQIFCTSFHSSCWLHQITTVHCLTNSAVACWRCCCHCSWSPSSSHDLHCMVFGQASFTDFWEINFGLIVLISFLCHQSGVLSFGLYTSSKPVISSAWHFDLFWQSIKHIKWNDQLVCEYSLAIIHGNSSNDTI